MTSEKILRLALVSALLRCYYCLLQQPRLNYSVPYLLQNEQYGLSFINLHSPPDDTDGDSAEKTTASPSVTVSITK